MRQIPRDAGAFHVGETGLYFWIPVILSPRFPVFRRGMRDIRVVSKNVLYGGSMKKRTL